MINYIREYFERRKVRKTFKRYVSKDVIRLIEKEPGRYFTREPQLKHFQFVIVLIDESKPEEISALLEKITGTFFRHGMILDQIFFSLVTAHAGLPFEQHNKPETRLAAVGDLVRENGNRVKVAHGEATGLIGNFGCELRFSWGALIPNFLDILRKLMDAPPGTVIEIPEAKTSS